MLINSLWAPKNLAVKLTFESFSPTVTGLLRWGLFAVLLALLMRSPRFRAWTNATPLEAIYRRPAFLIGLLLFAPAHVLYYVGVNFTSTIESTVLHTSLPIWSALLAAVVLREHVSARRWLAIFACAIGAYVVAVGFGAPSLSGNTLGNALYLLAVFVESFGLILIARVLLRSTGIGALLYQAAGMALGFALASALIPGDLGWRVSALTPAAVGGMGYLIVFSTLVCFTVWCNLVKDTPVSLVMMSMGLQPLLATVLGWWMLGERVGAHTWVGGVIVLGALVFAACEKPVRREPPAASVAS